MLPVDTRVLANPAAVAEEACRLIGVAAQAAIRERGIFRIVLAGGSTPGRTYQLLAQKFGVNWKGRDYNPENWDVSDLPNRCLSSATAALYCRPARQSRNRAEGGREMHSM